MYVRNVFVLQRKYLLPQHDCCIVNKKNQSIVQCAKGGPSSLGSIESKFVIPQRIFLKVK